jgi:serine/threonine protein kinase
MGALYLAVSGDRGLEKLCALKTVLPNLSDKEYVGRFRDEAKVVVKLSHGNLVQVFDAGQVGGELYLAMEFIEGKDLRAVWNRCARKGIAFPVDVAVHIIKELCRGLGYAHTFGDLKLVHRDVSPPNVLLAYSGEVKLTDFGLASSTLKREKTAPGVIYGKVSYMSPEQARGESLDGRTDLYTAAVLLWEMLTGRQLFPQGDRQPGDLLQDVKHPKIEPPSTRASRVTNDLDAIVMKCLSIDRESRYQTGEEMRQALAAYLAATSPTTDAARITQFLKDLFGEDIERENKEREAMVARVREQLKTTQQVPSGRVSARLAAADSDAVTSTNGPQVSSGVLALATPAPELVPIQDTANLINQLLDGRYKVLSLIGEGGMGRVYMAEHAEIGKRVALKVLHPVYSRTPEVVERFRREARAASKIGHPNIVDVTDSGTTPDGNVYFVMEYLEGVELAKVIDTGGALEIGRALAIASQICRAVAAAHAAGIIHRDLKPENIFLVSRDGQGDFVKVLDFGIAKSAELEESRERKLTHPGMAMGTPEYMAPEQAAGKPYDHRIDVYSAGAILYEMLTGAPPYDGENFMEVLTKKATQEPVPPRELRPELPEDVERVVLYALSQDPAERPPSMEAFDYEITKCLSGRGPAVGKLLGLSPEISGMQPPVRQFGSEPSVTALTGEVARIARRKRILTWGVVGGALGVVIVVAGVASSRKPPETIDVAAAQTQTQMQTGTLTPTGTGTTPTPTPAAAQVPVQPTPAPPAVEAPPPVERPPAHKAARDPGAGAKRQLAEARRQLSAGHFNDAKQGFSRLVDGRERAPALLGLSEIAFQQQSYSDAARYAKQALGAGGGIAARVALGNANFRLQKYGDASREYKTVLRAQPNNPEAKRGLEAAEKRLANK